MAPVRLIADMPLSPAQKVALSLEILRDYARVRWLLRKHDFRTVVRYLRETPRDALADTLEPGSLHARHIGARLGKSVWKTLRLLPTDSRCLMQALVLTAVMTRRGLEGQLVIGVKSDPTFEAHAWIEHNGIALLPHDEYGESRLVEV